MIRKNTVVYARWGRVGYVATRSGDLRMRDYSGMMGKVVAKFERNTRLVILSSRGNWYHVRIGKLTGWIYRRYVRLAKR